ncbi:MAG: DUF5711 family protein [Lachnospiraceae bacterium]|nr:DUF5711 family protein [Lachnospiraceae bacterium]
MNRTPFFAVAKQTGAKVGDIRNFAREGMPRTVVRQERKDKRVKKQVPYQKKIHRHRRILFYRILFFVILIALILFFVIRQYKNKQYTDYTIISSTPVLMTSQSNQMRLGDAILIYSKDGAHCLDKKGEVLWNQTYQMQDPMVRVCGDIVAIGDYGRRDIYVQSSKEILGHFTTLMPVESMAVASNGNVVVTMIDVDATKIYIYTPTGELLYEGEATMHGSGYPTAISLSPGGQLMAISYLQADQETKSIKCHVAFYNLGEVGDNYADQDRLVSAYNYTDSLVPYLQFMDDTTSFAVSEDRLMFYRGRQTPESAGEYFLTNREVLSVYHNDSYVGLVFYGGEEASSLEGEELTALYTIELYNANAKKVNSIDFHIEYTNIFFDSECIVIYNEQECEIFTMTGKLKYRGSFEKPIRVLTSGGVAYRYEVLTNDSLDVIQLK